jgi:hypothetical protein
MGITKWDPWQITYGGKMSDRIVIVGGALQASNVPAHCANSYQTTAT